MTGCHDILSGGCSTTYDIVSAKVIGGCHQVHTMIYHNDEYHDNGLDPMPYTYGDCQVLMLYKNKHQCYLHRFDFDRCTEYVTDIQQYNKCDRLNNHSYPIGSEHTIYVNKQSKICYSHHYVSVLSEVGLSFMIASFICILYPIISILFQKTEEQLDKRRFRTMPRTNTRLKRRNVEITTNASYAYNPIIPHEDDFAQIL